MKLWKWLLIIIPSALIVGLVLYVYIFIADLFVNGRGVHLLYEDNTSNHGKFSCINEDKIYYFSNEDDRVNGIYQMDLDGTNVSLVAECPDARRIAAFDDKLYYVGLFKHYSDDYGDRNLKYGIFECDKYEDAQRIAPEIVDVYDAYFFDNENILFLEGYKKWGWGDHLNGIIHVITDGNVIKYQGDYFTETQFYMGDDDYYIRKHISEPIMFIGWSSIESLPEEDAPVSEDDFGIDSFNGNRIFDVYNRYDIYDAKFLADSNEVLFYKDNQMHIFDIEKEDIVFSFELDLDHANNVDFDWDTYVFGASNDMIYATINTDKGTFYPTRNIALIIDKNTGTFNEILPSKNFSGSYLYFDENKLVTIENGNIYKYSHDGEKIINSYKLVFIESKSIDVSVSGDWLFIYKSGSEKHELEDIYHILLYKINIETGEVIQNTQPFSKEQHEAICVEETTP